MTQRHWVSMTFSQPAAQDRTCGSSSAAQWMTERPRCLPVCCTIRRVSSATGFHPPKRRAEAYGTPDDAADPALPADDTRPGREHGTASGSACRRFETGKRKFVAVDVPGHSHDTRIVAEGASVSDLALILVDARKGVLTQSRLHSYIVSLMGIRHAVLAVNKMDLVDYDRQAYSSIVETYEPFAYELGIERFDAVPVSALTGENVVVSGDRTPWYDGPTLMEILEAAETGGSAETDAFRLAVRRADPATSPFRGLSGTVLSGAVEHAMSVAVSPSGRTSTVERILGPSGDLERAVGGPVDHARAGRRHRSEPRRHALGDRPASRSRRSVCRSFDLDGHPPHGAGTGLFGAFRGRVRGRANNRAGASGRCR